jgi:hypothetical protein
VFDTNRGTGLGVGVKPLRLPAAAAAVVSMSAALAIALVVTATLLPAARRAAASPAPARSSAPVADYNGDGYGDLAITVQYESVGDAFAAGAVAVIYGGPKGLQADAPDDQLWTDDNLGEISRSDESFGNGLASGDFDGDGHTDLAIGVPEQNVGPRKEAGAVHVIYGSDAGLQTTAPPKQYWTQDSPGVDDEVEGYDHLGWALASGDFNGDGYADLVMDAEQDEINGWSDAGAANVLYGSPSGLQTDAPADQFWNAASPGIDQNPGNGFGETLAVGDFDGNGYDDVAFGEPERYIDGQYGAGAAYVLYGSAAGLQSTEPPAQYWTQDAPGVQEKTDEYEFFGQAVAAGDFNGDGRDELAVGVPEQSVRGYRDAGFVQVLYGSPEGLRSTNPDDQIWSQNSVGVKDKADLDEKFGSSLTSADWNGDGVADLAIGILREKLDHASLFSVIEVMYGSPEGIQATVPDDQLWSQESPDVHGDAGFGLVILGRDLNGDGVDDLAVGNPYDTIEGGDEDIGTLSVLFGVSGGLQAIDPPDQLWSQATPGIHDDAEEYDHFGSALG